MSSIVITIDALEAEQCADLDAYSALRVVWAGEKVGHSDWLENTPANRKQLAAIMDSVVLEARTLKIRLAVEIEGRKQTLTRRDWGQTLH